MIKNFLQSLRQNLSGEHSEDSQRFVGITALVSVSALFILVLLLTPSTPYPIESKPEQTLETKLSSQGEKSFVIPRFKDQTLEAGISFSHLQGDEELTGLNEVVGPGACAFDYDNDGWVDLFLVNGTGQTRFYGRQYWWQQPRGHALYRNLGNGKFEDVTTVAGLDKRVWGMGCVSGDLDNDGNSDLLITTFGPNYLYKNTGEGHFIDVTSQAGIDGNKWSTSAALADFDGDGLLDIYIANYIRFEKGARTYEANSQFGVNLSSSFDSTLYDAEENVLLRNLGDLKFEDVTKQAEVGNAGGRSLDVAWLDANEDGYSDLLVINDSGISSNTLFLNQGNGTFEEAKSLTGVNTALGNTGVSTGDIDNDGDLDIVIGSNNKYPPLVLIKSDTPILKNVKTSAAKGFYSDLSRSLGVGDERLVGLMGWSPGIYDYNNDGWLDIFMTNGLYTPDPDSHKIPQGQPKQLWLNLGFGRYIDTDDQNLPFKDTQSARGAAFADFDNDGDIDVYVAHNNDLGQLLINETSGQHWLGIKLVSKSGNPDAIGSRVWLHSKSGTQLRVVTNGNGFLSDSDRRLHFGLGNQDNVEKLVVRWNNGRTQEYSNPPIDRYITLTQDETKIVTTTPALQPSPKQSTSSVQLKVGMRYPKNRLRYLQWLIESEGVESAIDEIETAARDNDASIRAQVIDLIGTHKSSAVLKIVVNALNDESTEVQLAAINALKFFEEEATVRWLLRAFNHPDEKVRIAVADSFGFFYREEEAVIYRKYLAVPHLIRLLDDLSPRVRIAAARALGDAEKYRGVAPLINHLADSDPTVRSEAARALGLIRERKAVTPLLELLADQTQPANVHAHALIALKRLNYHDINEAMQSVFKGSATHGLETLLYISNNSNDGIVISHKLLGDLIKPYADHNMDEVREYAIPALIELSPERQNYYIKKGLNDKSISVRVSTLKALKDNSIQGPKKLLVSQLSDSRTASYAIPLLERYSDYQTTSRLFSVAINEKYQTDIRVAALNCLSKAKGALPKIPNKLLNSNNRELRIAALRYWANQSNKATDKIPDLIEKAINDQNIEIQTAAIDILFNRKERWGSDTIKQVLFDPQSKPSLRRYIIENLSNPTPKESIGWLLKLVRNPAEPERVLAMKSLLNRSNEQMEYFMWQLLKNSRENEQIRFLAAESLAPRHGKEVLKILRGKV